MGKEKFRDDYPVNKVSVGFNYWCQNLREKVYQLFQWGGLPPTLPSSEIMKRLITYGAAPIFYSTKVNNYVTCNFSMTGFDIYSHPTSVTYAQPVLGSDTLTIGKDVEIISFYTEYWFTRFKFQDTIKRYAKLLADLESTIDIALVNMRMTRTFQGNDNKTRDEIIRVYRAFREGEYDAISSSTILDKIKEMQTDKEDPNFGELIALRDNIIKAFYEEIGINYVARKTERFLKDELQSNNQILNAAIVPILTSVKYGVTRVNKLFGTNFSVCLNPIFTPNTYAPEQNGVVDYTENSEGGLNNV